MGSYEELTQKVTFLTTPRDRKSMHASCREGQSNGARRSARVRATMRKFSAKIPHRRSRLRRFCHNAQSLSATVSIHRRQVYAVALAAVISNT